MENKVDILIAAYNSEKYIEEQINSILKQTYKNIHIIAADDLSTDNTFNILTRYKNQYNNIDTYKNNENLGVKKNFLNLIQNSKSDYIMLSDHDDVWFEDKVELSMNKIIELEKIYGETKPILVFSDKIITDRKLNIIHNSHSKMENFNTNDFSINKILTQNVISGCTVIINKALINMVKNTDKFMIMHDYWLALIASAFGVIEYINKPLMYYRQHESNEIGGKNYSIKYMINNALKGKEKLRNTFMNNINQAESFYKIYCELMDNKTKDIFQNFISLKNKRNIDFIKTIYKYKFLKSGTVKNIGLIYAFF